MRILHIISSVNGADGGPIEGVLQLNRALAVFGHTTEIATLDAPDAPWVVDNPRDIHSLGPAQGSYRYGARFIPWLRRYAAEYDHVIVNGLWQYHSFASWLTLRKLGKSYVVYTHGMLDPWFKRTYPLKHLKKSLYWPWAEYRVLRDAQAVCFTCEEERLLASQSFALYSCNEAVVNYGTTGPPGDRIAPREAFWKHFPNLRGKRCLLFLSRLHVKKGCDLLLDAFARVAAEDPALHLVMAGPDQTGWRARLERQARDLGIADRITWTGMVSGDLKWGAFYAAEVFVLPSHQENFGIAVAEALACGLPVLISDRVNIWREIVESGAGLTAADTVAGTTDLLRRWLALSPDERLEMARRAEQCFERHFEMKRAAQGLLRVLSGNVSQMAVPGKMTA